MNGNPLKIILSRLNKPQKHGDRYTAICPAHDDKSPSLSLSLGNDDRVLIHCHAGCKTEDVLAAIGLKMHNLFASDLDDKQRRQYHRETLAKECIFEHLIIECARSEASHGKELSEVDAARLALAEERTARLERQIAELDKKECRSSPSAPQQWRAELISAASITPVPILWLWPGWLARGKLIVLAGAGGSGKSTLAISLGAIVTNGGVWPDDTQCSGPGNVLIWSSEDDPADTLIPRLIAAGADLERVRIIKGRLNDLGGSEPFDPATDIDLLYQEMDSIGGAALLVIDPVVSAVKGDMHRANDVRRSLQPLVDFAEAHQCAVLGISHFSKNTSGSLPADRVIGSQAFGALARTVLVAAKQEDSEDRILARAKSNISVDQGGICYQIKLHTIDAGIEAVRVEWSEPIEGSAREILASVEGFADEESGALKEAEQFLKSRLAAGSVPSTQIKAEAKAAGHALKTLERAKKSLGVESYKEDMKGPWSWRLSTEDRQETTKAATENSDDLQERMAAFRADTFDESDSEAF